MVISQLLFADNTQALCGADVNQICHLSILLCLEAVYGLRINSSKYEMVPIGAVDDIGVLAGTLGCKISALPLKYLGLPLGAPHKACTIWDGIIEKMEKRLAGGKKLYLSKRSLLL